MNTKQEKIEIEIKVRTRDKYCLAIAKSTYTIS